MASTHPRDMRARIWRAVLCATDQEIRDGMDFYPGAHGLCKLFAAAFRVTVESAAGVYAALSPMNGWDTNVANTAEVLRWANAPQERNGEFPKVNTSSANRDKAIAIACGAYPLEVLRGRKVRAFYAGIANPDDTSPIPVDRHLIVLALGRIPEKRELSRLASNATLYSRVESAYAEVGQRENLGNRIASIAWFVQRRILRTGQTPLLQPGAFVCCGHPMQSQGTKRRLCVLCGKSVSKTPDKGQRRDATFGRVDGFRITSLHTRRIIHCGKGHPYANQRGWQYLSRYIVMKELARRIEKDEHVHHVNHDKSDDRLDGSNYQLLLAESHGKYHRYLADLAGYRDDLGRFTEHAEPRVL